MTSHEAVSFIEYTLKQQPVSLLAIPPELLSALQHVDQPENLASIAPEPVTQNALEKLQEEMDEGDTALTCRTCDLTFAPDDRESQRKHYKTDWHRYNIKRKLMLGEPPVTLEEFESMLADITESLSGSESASDEEEEREENDSKEKGESTAVTDHVATLVNKQTNAVVADEPAQRILTPLEKKYSAMAWFTAPSVSATLHVGIYRTFFSGKEFSVDTLRKLQWKKGSKRQWTILLLGGGHFAGAVIDIDQSAKQNDPKQIKMTHHKTIHRYTTRRKQGGSQSALDNAKGKANSAGAQIRRYNEMMLQQEVRQAVEQWKPAILESEFIFVHAPSNNRTVLFGYEGAVLDKSNPKIRSVPFVTRRPTLDEIRRIFLEITNVKLVDVDPATIEAHQQAIIDKMERARKQLEKSRIAATKTTEAVEASNTYQAPPELKKLVFLTKQGKEQVVLSFIRKHEPVLLPMVSGRLPDEGVTEEEGLGRLPTILHIAATCGHAELVSRLIREFESDPTIQTASGKTAYEVAKDKRTRNAFRRCMYDLSDQWDWLRGARVPSPLSPEAEVEQAEKDMQRQERELQRRRAIEEERRRREQEQAEKEKAKEATEKRQQQTTRRTTPSMAKTLGGARELANTAAMTPEARMRLEREKRARAAEERMRRLQNQ